MDGLTATQEIRRMEAAGEIEGPNLILALTGNAREGHVQAALGAGMDDVVVSIIILHTPCSMMFLLTPISVLCRFLDKTIQTGQTDGEVSVDISAERVEGEGLLRLGFDSCSSW